MTTTIAPRGDPPDVVRGGARESPVWTPRTGLRSVDITSRAGRRAGFARRIDDERRRRPVDRARRLGLRDPHDACRRHGPDRQPSRREQNGLHLWGRRPVQVAPWAEETVAANLPGVQRRLRGEGPCLRFGIVRHLALADVAADLAAAPGADGPMRDLTRLLLPPAKEERVQRPSSRAALRHLPDGVADALDRDVRDFPRLTRYRIGVRQ